MAAVNSVVLAVTTAALPENFMLAITNVSTAAPMVATISLHALIRHQYQRRIRTAPVPAPMPRTIVQPVEIEKMLLELLDQFQREEQALNLDKVRHKIAASIACHAAIKINTPLEQNKMEWLLKELAKTECPMTCPHGRPVVLRYSIKDIQRAFKRI